MEVIGEAGSGEDACRICLEYEPDVSSWISVSRDSAACRPFGKSGRRPSVRFIVLTTYDGDEDIRRALDAGAQAYLLKAMSHLDVTAAIRKVHAGARVIPQSVSRTIAERPPQSRLSPREIEVLELIANGCSNKEVGRALGITEATVKWHVNLILNKTRCRRSHGGDRCRAPARHHPLLRFGRWLGPASIYCVWRTRAAEQSRERRGASGPRKAKRLERGEGPPRPDDDPCRICTAAASGRAPRALQRISRSRLRRPRTAISDRTSGVWRVSTACGSSCSTPATRPPSAMTGLFAVTARDGTLGPGRMAED